MKNHFKILQPVHTFSAGETHPADAFPRGTDFGQLVKLGVIHPTDGGPVPVSDSDASGWKTRALEAEAEVKRLLDLPTAQLPKEKEDRYLGEMDRLNERIDELQAEIQSNAADFTAKLRLMGDPGAALAVVIAERDQARAQLARSVPEEFAESNLEAVTEQVNDTGNEKPVNPNVTEGIDPNTLSVVMNMTVPEIDAELSKLNVEVPTGTGKKDKALLLIKSGFVPAN